MRDSMTGFGGPFDPYGVEYQMKKAEEAKANSQTEAKDRVAAHQAASAASGTHSSGVQLPPWAMEQMAQGTLPQGGPPAPRTPTPPPEQLALHKRAQPRAPQQQATESQALSQALRAGV